jgi:phosphoribosylamine--glycine ligase
MMRLKTDLVDVMLAATEPGPHGKLDQVELEWDRRTALGVVLAAYGYPLQPRKGDVITGIPKAEEDAVVFHAGTALAPAETGEPAELQTSGGRVLCVTVLADNARLAQQRAYEVAAGIRFDGMQYRTDIGYRAIKGAAA